MKRLVISSIVLVLCSIVLGATVFREEVAQAAQAILPVKVMNGPADAVPVVQQGTATVRESRIPVNFFLQARPAVPAVVYHVPADKRLVIEYVNGFMLVDAGFSPESSLTVKQGDTSMAFSFAGTFLPNSTGRYQFSEDVTIHADAGTDVTWFSQWQSNLSASGYLVPVNE